MENISRDKWNSFYKSDACLDVANDSWLSKHLPLLKNNERVLELGCGTGANAHFLSSLGFRVTATDFSNEALARLKSQDPLFCIQELDIRDLTAVPENSFDSVVADLCLHYFDEPTLAGISDQLRRILVPGGKLFERLNAVYDGIDGVMVSEGYYYMNGIYRMFFTEDSVRRPWASWDILSLSEYDIFRYGGTKKTLFELVCKNIKPEDG